jgi:hypothetical protein
MDTRDDRPANRGTVNTSDSPFDDPRDVSRAIGALEDAVAALRLSGRERKRLKPIGTPRMHVLMPPRYGLITPSRRLPTSGRERMRCTSGLRDCCECKDSLDSAPKKFQFPVGPDKSGR